jgi:tRNA 5-methylaminomethyl-2-thiouridine biosynthesis bifunctional protein
VKTEPIVAATIDFSQGVPRSAEYDDVYHPREGALEQARSVFLAGNGLPGRWRGRQRFTILETGFGLGNNFLATWAAWRSDPLRCDRLHFVSLEKHPPTRDGLAHALAASPLPALTEQLLAAWPPLTPNVHSLGFEGGRLQLLLCLGDATTLARQLVARVDAFYLDGFAPARNDAMWSPPLFKSLAKLAAPDATAATWSAARVVRDGLAAAGFDVQRAPGAGAKREITLARYAPRFVPIAPPGRALPSPAPSHAIVIGGGIAGAATARALAQQGVPCTVLDAQTQPATQASGNPAGLFHGTVGADDALHTRWHRAASFAASQWVRASGAGACDGMLRLNTTQDLAAMRALLAAQRLPSSYVQALDAAQASQHAGVPLAQPAWMFAAGGWADPVALVHDALAMPGVTWRGGAAVQSIAHDGEGWCARDADARLIARAPALVLANAHDALRLAGLPPTWAEQVRGQVSWVDAPQLALLPQQPPMPHRPPRLPHMPIASGAFVLPLPGGGLLIGSTSHPGDDDEHVRDADHASNLERARHLLGSAVARDGAALHGRVGWRVVTHDRLPLVGLAPDLQAPRPARRDAPRLLPRVPGLYLHSALGSRGLTTAALGGQLLAAQICGAPWPLEADLADAIDPARMVLRTNR